MQSPIAGGRVESPDWLSDRTQSVDTINGIVNRLATRHQNWPDWQPRDLLIASLLLGVLTAAMLGIRSHLNVLNVALIFLIVVVLIPSFANRQTSIAAAIVAFLVLDFFFVPPYHAFSVADLDHVLVLFVFLGVATLVSQLIYRVRVRTVEALARGRQMMMLFELSQALIADVTVGGILNAVVGRTASTLGVSSCAILLADDDGTLHVRASVGMPPPIEDRDHAAVAQWAVEQRQPAGLGQRRSKSMPPGRRGAVVGRKLLSSRMGAHLYVPIRTTNRVSALLYVHDTDTRHQFSSDDQQLLLTFANQIALALDRVRLGEEATQAAVLVRSDALKTALLSAVSHDLRTPLAAIKASATSLLQEGIAWDPADQRDLLQAIDEEADRLTRLIGNLLDLTRIEAGELRPYRDWSDPLEVVRETISRVQPLLPHHTIVTDLPDELPLVLLDDIEIGQVLFNLFENAGKYAPIGTTIEVGVESVAGGVLFRVDDRGIGIPPGEVERVFDKFYRVEQQCGPRGAGIGLAICRGIIDAHGGRIWVEDRNGGGTSMRFILPLVDQPPKRESEATWQRAS